MEGNNERIRCEAVASMEFLVKGGKPPTHQLWVWGALWSLGRGRASRVWVHFGFVSPAMQHFTVTTLTLRAYM